MQFILIANIIIVLYIVKVLFANVIIAKVLLMAIKYMIRLTSIKQCLQ